MMIIFLVPDVYRMIFFEIESFSCLLHDDKQSLDFCLATPRAEVPILFLD